MFPLHTTYRKFSNTDTASHKRWFPWLALGYLISSLTVLSAVAGAQDLASFERRIFTKILGNGLTLVVYERHNTPVFSTFTYIDVGSDRDAAGHGGLAHMFEHMAFKGSNHIGTTDPSAEEAALAQVEKAYADYSARRCCDKKESARLESAWKDAIAAADKYIIRNQFAEILHNEGAAAASALTTKDETGYYCSLPANDLELWAFLESERFRQPVMREFYKERNVVMEERRTQVENQALGRFREQFLAAAFIVHPYRNPIVGWPSEIEALSATDAIDFFEQYYVPSNITIAIVGDVEHEAVWTVAGKYFGRLQSRPRPQPLRSVEPRQNAERRITMRDEAQPFYMEGYHRPPITDNEDAVFAVIQDIMSNGHTSRLYRSLVRDRRIAATASSLDRYPGQKYPNLFVFSAVPLSGHTTEEIEEEIQLQIEKLKAESVTDEELRKAKLRLKANLGQIIDNNSEMAAALARSQALFGDWRQLVLKMDQIDHVTSDDVRRVANATFVPSNRTVGTMGMKPAVAPPPK